MKYGQVEAEKLYFTSNEAAELIGVSVETLRIWEKEYPELSPQKNKAGKRIYRPSDIEIARQIGKDTSYASYAPLAKKTSRKKPEPTDKELLLKIKNRLQKTLQKIKSGKGDSNPRP